MDSWLKPESLVSLNYRLLSIQLIALCIFQWQMGMVILLMFSNFLHIVFAWLLVLHCICCIFLFPDVPLGWVFISILLHALCKIYAEEVACSTSKCSSCWSNLKFRTRNQSCLVVIFIAVFQGLQLAWVLCLGFYVAHTEDSCTQPLENSKQNGGNRSTELYGDLFRAKQQFGWFFYSAELCKDWAMLHSWAVQPPLFVSGTGSFQLVICLMLLVLQ